MMFHKDTGSDEPCKHMEGHLHHVADGTAGPLRLWYTLAHVARCPQCRRFLDSLKSLLSRLHRAKNTEPSQEAMERMLSQYRTQSAASGQAD